MHTAGAYPPHHRSPPPPPPPPPQLPPILSSSPPSMTSTLSALAPPFTLDHALPSPPPLRPLVDPYYGHYSQSRPFDDSFGSSSSYSRVGCGPWNGPFDEEVGRGIRADAAVPWTEPTSSHKVPSFHGEYASDDCCYYDTDYYDVWHGKLTDSLTGHFGSQHSEWLQDKHIENYGDMTSSYTVFNAPFSTPSTSLGVHSSGTMGSTSGKGSHDPFVINSTYDRYMAQLDSCSVNPLVCYPSMTCSTPTQAPTTFKAGANINSTLQSTTMHDVPPYMINDPLPTTSRVKEPCLNQNIGISDDEKKLGNYNKPRIVTVTTLQPAEFGKNTTLSKNGAIEINLNSSVGSNPELNLKNVVNADASPARCSSMEPDKSIRSSSEALDQHSLAVDSPCWRGAPASRQSPFTVDAMLVKVASAESKDLNVLAQDQTHLLEDAGNPPGSLEQVGILNLDKYRNSSFSEKPQFLPVVTSCLYQNPESGDKVLFDHRKNNHENGFLYDTHRKQIDKTINVKKRDSEAHGVSCSNFVATENTAVNNFPPKDIDDNNKGTCSSQKNTEDLVKAIHNYSVDLLLSTNFSNDELEPPYCRLLYSAINNISLVLRDSKVLAGFSHCSGLEAAQSCNRCLNAEDVNQSNINQTCKGKEKMHFVGCNNSSGEYDNFGVKGSEAGPSNVNGTTQTVENALSEIFPDREENEQTLLYKNLWMEAETTTCRLKYELQLARMKIETENMKPPQSELSSSLPFAPELKGYNSHENAKTSSLGTISPSLCSGSQHDAPACHGLNKSPDIESSVMARLKVLQARNVILNDRSLEEQGTVDTEEPSICSIADENVHGSACDKLNLSVDIEPSVMARLKVLQDRDISLNNRNVEKQEAVEPVENARICPGTNENVHGSPHAENNSEKNDLPMNLAELGFVESVPQLPPYANGNRRSPWSLFSSGSFGTTTSEEQGKYLNGSEEGNNEWTLNELLIQSYLGYKQMNHPYGHEVSSSFEWEHVREEETPHHPQR